MALPAVVLGVQCAMVSVSSLGVTVWARVAYDSGTHAMETIKSLPAVAAAKSRALVHSVHLSTVQRQPMRPSVTGIYGEGGAALVEEDAAPLRRRLTDARYVIEQCERKRLAAEAAKEANAPKDDEWFSGGCGA